LRRPKIKVNNYYTIESPRRKNYESPYAQQKMKYVRSPSPRRVQKRPQYIPAYERVKYPVEQKQPELSPGIISRMRDSLFGKPRVPSFDGSEYDRQLDKLKKVAY
jgi:hypothetical protein